MKILFLTPGTGSYYCGACMRDNILARELQRLGHDVTIAPMYLPLMIDGETVAGLDRAPIFFGGINVYLQQKVALFRRTPAFVDRLFNSRGLLRWVARHSHMTSARDQGELTLEMFQVDSGPLRKECDKLFEWIEQAGKPDVVCLSNALLAGFAGEMKRRLGAPVVIFFQGEDSFLDGLPEPWRTRCWTAMGERLRGEGDALLAPSRYYADFMRERLGWAPGLIDVAYNGVATGEYAPAATPAGPPAIGYLARMTREKGLEALVDAFIVLARDLGDTSTLLKIGGACTAGDEPLVREMKRRLAGAGLAARVEWRPNLSREEKVAFLRGLVLFSVPATYAEAFGLYLIEAMACGVPVVQPASAAFPEIIGAGGGGECVRPRDAAALAQAWQRLLADPAGREKMGRDGRLSVEKHFSARTMGAQFSQVADRFARAPA